MKATALLLLLLPIAAQPQDTGLAEADALVARFAGQTATRAELAEWLLVTTGELESASFAEGFVYARRARELGFPDPEPQARAVVEAEIQERISQAYGGRDEGWLRELESANRTPAGRRAERLVEVTRDLNLFNIANHERVVPEEKVIRDWERAYGPDGRRLKVRVFFRRVVMPPMPGMNRAEQLQEQTRIREERAAELLAIRERVRAGEPFGKICSQSSDDPATRGTGGRPPEGGLLNTLGWPKDALEEIAALEPGDICDPVTLQGGLWIVQLEKVIVTPFESVEDELRANLVALGPESDELAATSQALLDGVVTTVLPAMFEQSTPEAPLDWSEPVLTIGDVAITRAEYAEYLLHVLGDVSVRRFAEERFIEHLAAEAGIAPTKQEIEARVESDAQHLIDYFHGGDRAAWEAETTRVRGSVQSWYRDARFHRRIDLILGELFLRDREITDDLLRQMWRARYGEDGRSLHLRMIRIDAVAPDLPEGVSEEEAQRQLQAALAEARALAAQVAERAADGEDFAALARQFSMDKETKDAGGELPLGFDHGTLPPAAVAVVEAMSPGEVSAPVDLEYVHMIFELIDVRNVPFESVKEELRAELESAEPTNVEVRGHYNVLTRDLKIEVLPGILP